MEFTQTYTEEVEFTKAYTVGESNYISTASSVGGKKASTAHTARGEFIMDYTVGSEFTKAYTVGESKQISTASSVGGKEASTAYTAEVEFIKAFIAAGG